MDSKLTSNPPRFPQRWSLPVQYALALSIAMLAVTIRWLMDPLLENRVSFGLVTAAMLPLVMLVRPLPFLCAFFLGWAVSWYLFVFPQERIPGYGSIDWPILVITGASLSSGLVAAAVSSREARFRHRALRKIHDHETLMRVTFDNAAVGIAHVGLDGRWLRFNDSLCAILGHARGQLKGKTFAEITHPEDLEEDLRQVRNLIEGKVDSFAMEKRYIRADGGILHALLNVALMRKPDGSPDYFISVISDITERKRLGDELQLRGRQFEMLLNQAPLGVYLVDADFCLRQLNPQAREVFSPIRGELIGRNFQEILKEAWPETSAEKIARIFRTTMETGEPTHVAEHADDRSDRLDIRYYDWRAERIVLPDGRYGVACYFHDISEQVNARMAIARSEERYRTLFNTIEQGFCILDVLHDDAGKAVDYRFIEANPAFARHTGLVDPVGKRVKELVPDIEARWPEIYGRVAATGVPERFVNGSTAMGRWFEVEAFKVSGPHAHRVGLLFTNISDRKMAEDALRESEERLRIALEAADLGVWDLDLASGSMTRSLRHDQFFGHPELLPEWSFEQTLQQIVTEDREIARAGNRQAEDSGNLAYEVRVQWPDGSIHWIGMYGRVYRESGVRPPHIVGVIADVTARKEAERTLRESRGKAQARAHELGTLMNLVPALVFHAHDPEGRRVTANRYAREMLRMPGGRDFSLAAEILTQPEGLDQVASGSPSWQSPIRRAAGGERVYDQELEFNFGPSEIRHLLCNAVPILDENGESRGALAAMIDITERKRAEESLLEANRRKDEFLATLAHELRNPMAAIRLSMNVMERQPNDQKSVRAMTSIIDRQSAQLVRLIDDLLDVSRISRGKISLQLTRLDIVELVRQSVIDTQGMCAEAGITVTTEFPGQPVFCPADHVRFTQIITNLLHNACKFTPRGGTVRVSVNYSATDAIVTIADNGRGIGADQLAEIFELFVQDTAHGMDGGGGLGIGLSLAKSIIELHGGRIAARSPGMGKGSEFIVSLPLADHPENAGPPAPAPALPMPAAPIPEASPPPPVRVLAADDNTDALLGLSMLLELGGHHVTTADDGADALEKAFSQRPEIVLLDIGMPKLDGYEVARRIRSQPWGAGLLLIAMTGWGQDQDKLRAQEAGFDFHLTKPVDPQRIEALIADWRKRPPAP